jgi:hypothetical protein
MNVNVAEIFAQAKPRGLATRGAMLAALVLTACRIGSGQDDFDETPQAEASCDVRRCPSEPEILTFRLVRNRDDIVDCPEYPEPVKFLVTGKYCDCSYIIQNGLLSGSTRAGIVYYATGFNGCTYTLVPEHDH